MAELDMNFAAEFRSGSPLSFRDVGEMSRRVVAADSGSAQFFPALTAGLNAICCVLWQRPVDDVRDALARAFLPADDSTYLEEDLAPPSPWIDAHFGSGTSDRPADRFAFGSQCSATLFQLGLPQKPDFLLGLALRLPVSLEAVVWSAVRASPIRDFFVQNEDTYEQMWLAKPGSRGSSNWITAIEGLQVRPGNLGPQRFSFHAGFSEGFGSILVGARNA